MSHESHRPCCSGLKPIKSSGTNLWIPCQTKYGVSKGVGHILEFRERAVQGFRELTMGYLGVEPKAEKAGGLGDLGKIR